MRRLISIDNPVIRKLSVVADIVILNFILIITSLPLINLIGNLISMNEAIQHLRAHKGYPYSIYFHGMIRNFKRGFMALLIFAPLLYFGVASFLMSMRLGGFLALYSRICGVIGLIVWSIVLTTFIDYSARFEDHFKQTLINSFRIGPTNLRSILAGILLFVFLLRLLQPSGIVTLLYIGTFGGITALIWLTNYLFEPIYAKYFK